MSNQIHCLIEGEVLKVSEKSGAKGSSQIVYSVMARLPNGTQNILSKVPVATMFGGIADNFQFRLRGTMDDDGNAPSETEFFTDTPRKATLGDRVLIAFLGGHINRPVIVGFLPHPTTNWIYSDHESLTPQASFNYLGVTANWSDTGAFQFVKRGAPTMSFAPSGFSLPSLSLSKDPTLPPSHAALEPADESETIRMAFLDEGVFRLNDSAGQMIEFDHNKAQILISNNSLKATETESLLPSFGSDPDAEYVMFNSDDEQLSIGARSVLELYTGGERTDLTDGDYSSEISGSFTLTVEGDAEETISGAHTYTVEGGLEENIKSDWDLTVSGDSTISTKGDTNLETANLTITAKQDVEITGSQSTITLSQGKISIKGASGELVDLLNQLVQALLSMTVSTAVGPSGPPINASDFSQIQSKLQGMKM
jgi:hypothetical protein